MTEYKRSQLTFLIARKNSQQLYEACICLSNYSGFNFQPENQDTIVQAE